MATVRTLTDEEKQKIEDLRAVITTALLYADPMPSPEDERRVAHTFRRVPRHLRALAQADVMRPSLSRNFSNNAVARLLEVMVASPPIEFNHDGQLIIPCKDAGILVHKQTGEQYHVVIHPHSVSRGLQTNPWNADVVIRYMDTTSGDVVDSQVCTSDHRAMEFLNSQYEML